MVGGVLNKYHPKHGGASYGYGYGVGYGLGGGLFFLSYALLEVPSNLLLVRFGARRSAG